MPANRRVSTTILAIAIGLLASCGERRAPALDAARDDVESTEAEAEAAESVVEEAADDAAPAGSTPIDTVEAYLSAMAAHDGSGDLDIYTESSRSMMAGQRMNARQMDTLVGIYRDCPPFESRELDDHAVVMHPGENGQCSPWFLERGPDGRWRLDLVAMRDAIRFDDRNRWRIADRGSLAGYAFAFDD